MRIQIPIFFLLISIFLIPIASAENTYTHTFYDYVNSGNPQTVYSPSLRTDKTNCQVTISPYIDSTDETGGTYDIITEFYSPHNDLIGYGLRPMATNVTCLSHGNVTETNNNESQWESKVITTLTGATSHITRLTTIYECSFNDDWIELSTSGDDLDSDGYSPNIYFKFTCGTPGPPTYEYFITETEQDSCSGISNDYLIPGSHYFCCGVGCVANNENLGWWIMPFKTGESGRIRYSYSAPFTFSAFEEYGYFEMSDPAGTYIQLTTSSGNLTLQPNTKYGFYVHGTAPVGVQKSVNINISIEAYIPDWNCGSWSDCESGLQFRTCIDPLGKIPDKIEYRACIDTAYFELLLGFEEGHTPTTPVKKCELQYWPLCSLNPMTITNYIEYPTNWNIINPGLNYFLEMSNEQATEGSRSLKMWYIPPMVYYQYPSIPNCNWSNLGLIPQVYKGVNDSLFVSYNITFPSPYMTIDYDVKQCKYPVQQYDGWCGTQCYGYNGNCSESSVKGEYVSVLLNPTTGEKIYEFYDEAALSWQTKHIDLTGSNITIGETYNLVFAVYPKHITDAYGHCIYLDNVKISIRTAELSCESNYCVGPDLYKPTQLNQTCVYEIEYNSPECLSEENRPLAEQYKDYCIEQTLYSYNNDTQEWEETLNATYCIEKEQSKSIYDPLGIVEPMAAFFEPLGLGFILFFFAPIFLALMIAIAGAFYVIDKLAFDKQGSGLVFIIIFLSILGVESLIGIFPIWFTIMMIVISGLGVAWFLTRT